MDELESRLQRCFSVVFPELDEAQIRMAAMSSVEAWDSVATVTLMNVVEEEFGVQIDLEDVERLLSFSEFAAYVRSRFRTSEVA